MARSDIKTIWQTTDGKYFDNPDEAIKHQDEIDCRDMIDKISKEMREVNKAFNL